MAKKMFSINAHKIGKVKYSMKLYDGKAKHPDGSPFIGIATAKTKKEFDDKIKRYKSDGYVEVYDVFKELHESSPADILRSYIRKQVKKELNESTGNVSITALKKTTDGLLKKYFPQGTNKSSIELNGGMLRVAMPLGSSAEWGKWAVDSPYTVNFNIKGFIKGNGVDGMLSFVSYSTTREVPIPVGVGNRTKVTLPTLPGVDNQTEVAILGMINSHLKRLQTLLKRNSRRFKDTKYEFVLNYI